MAQRTDRQDYLAHRRSVQGCRVKITGLVVRGKQSQATLTGDAGELVGFTCGSALTDRLALRPQELAERE